MRLGASVALSADGSRLAIGATTATGDAPASGQARVYDFDGGSWIQAGGNINGEAGDEGFGSAIALSDDGSRLVVGAPGNGGNGVGAGQVRAYELSDGTWNKLVADIDGEAAGNFFGWSVAISADGTRIAAGGLANYARVFALPVASPPPVADLSLDPQNGGAMLSWNSRSNADYAIEVSTNLSDWEELKGSISSQGSETSFTETNFPAATPQRFYRIREN